MNEKVPVWKEKKLTFDNTTSERPDFFKKLAASSAPI